MVKEKLSGNHVGLTLGFFFAILHALWALAVGLGLGQSLIDWIFPLHFIDMACSLLAFSFLNALFLIILAFVGGYVLGWIFAWLWNCKCWNK